MFVNLTYSAEEVGSAIIPPGMVMSRDTPADAMREMATVDPGEVSYEAPADARGDRSSLGLRDVRIAGPDGYYG